MGDVSWVTGFPPWKSKHLRSVFENPTVFCSLETPATRWYSKSLRLKGRPGKCYWRKAGVAISVSEVFELKIKGPSGGNNYIVLKV